jgi:hypothetical protein
MERTTYQVLLILAWVVPCVAGIVYLHYMDYKERKVE